MSEETAEGIEEEIITDDPAIEVDGELATPDADETTQDGKNVESEEIEIVLEGQESLPKTKNKSFQHRINKLNQKTAVQSDRADKAEADLNAIREQNRLLLLAAEQKNAVQAPPKPNPDDFDGGAYDPKFMAQQEAHNQFQVGEQVKQQVDAALSKYTDTNTKQATSNTFNADLQGKQKAHYERAAKLNVAKYEEYEDKSIEIFGQNNVNEIIGNFDRSEVLLGYYGHPNNQEAATALADLMQHNPMQAVAKLGAAEERLVVRSKSKVAASPDEELEGGGIPKKGNKRGPPGATYT